MGKFKIDGDGRRDGLARRPDALFVRTIPEIHALLRERYGWTMGRSRVSQILVNAERKLRKGLAELGVTDAR